MKFRILALIATTLMTIESYSIEENYTYQWPAANDHLELGEFVGGGDVYAYVGALITTSAWGGSGPFEPNYNVFGDKGIFSLEVSNKYGDIISLEEQEFLSGYDLKVSFTGWMANCNPGDLNLTVTPVDFELEVTYSPESGVSMKHKDSFLFENNIFLYVSVAGISINPHGDDLDTWITNFGRLPFNAKVTSDYFVDKRYDFDPEVVMPYDLSHQFLSSLDDEDSSNNNFGADPDFGHTDMRLSWANDLVGVEYFELEWTYVDNYDEVAGEELFANEIEFTNEYFENNSSRVVLPASLDYYDIPLTFDKGFVAYRMRGVGYSGPDSEPHKMLTSGLWSSDGANDLNDFLPNAFQILEPHEPNKNWQVVTTFAEEGKKKEVISYYDGLNRNRQVVTRINSELESVVAETIYDYHGRAAINILPVPSGDSDLSFHENFNESNTPSDLTHPQYSASDFDLDGDDDCNQLPNPLADLSGAGMYYSPNQLLQSPEKHQDYTPNSFGYAFSQVQYTPDNTGRIRVQGGVGIEHQIGKKSTRYFYNQAKQIELDRLFGYEVGYAARYKKNIVVDPNNQVSVSYVDAHGRTIATALAGASPYNVAELDGVGLAEPISVDILSPESGYEYSWTDEPVSESYLTTITPITEAALNEFEYSMGIEPFDPNPCSEGNLPDLPSFDVVFDLNYSLIETVCQDPIFAYSTTVGQSNYPPDFDTSDEDLSDDIAGITSNTLSWGSDESEVLFIKDYSLSRSLTLNEEVMNNYAQYYAAYALQNGCIPEMSTLQGDFALELASQLDCEFESSCESCIEYAEESKLDGTFTITQYEIALEECEKLCNTHEPPNICDEAERAMMDDVTPGGQYGSLVVNEETQYTSVFYPESSGNIGHILPGDWRSPHSYITSEHEFKLVDLDFEDGIYTPEINSDSPEIIPVTYGDVEGYYSQELIDIVDDNDELDALEITSAHVEAYIHMQLSNYYNYGIVSIVEYQSLYYTIPQNLEDPLVLTGELWDSNFPSILVQHHPEYCLLEECRTMEDSNYPVTVNVDGVDETIEYDAFSFESYLFTLDENSPEFAGGFQVFAEGLIDIDPLFSMACANESMGDGTTIKSRFESKMTHYKYMTYDDNGTLNTIPMGIIQLSALTGQCGNWFGNNVFGADGCLTSESDILTLELSSFAEWQLFLGFYTSLRQTYQKAAVIFCAHQNDATCDNTCIGILNESGSQSQTNYWNCIFSNVDIDNGDLDPYGYVFDKLRRMFPRDPSFANSSTDEEELNELLNEGNATIYAETGLCPLTFSFQVFLSEMVAGSGGFQSLPNPNPNPNPNAISLVTVNSFVYSLYTQSTSGDGNTESPYIPLEWEAVQDADPRFLNVYIKPEGVAPGALTFSDYGFNMELEIPMGYGLDWTNFPVSYTLGQILPTGSDSFEMLLNLGTENAIYEDVVVYGTITNRNSVINLTGCQMWDGSSTGASTYLNGTSADPMAGEFGLDCTLSEYGEEFLEILRTIYSVSGGTFNSTENLNEDAYVSLSENGLIQALEVDLNTTIWSFDGSNYVLQDLGSNGFTITGSDLDISTIEEYEQEGISYSYDFTSYVNIDHIVEEQFSFISEFHTQIGSDVLEQEFYVENSGYGIVLHNANALASEALLNCGMPDDCFEDVLIEEFDCNTNADVIGMFSFEILERIKQSIAAELDFTDILQSHPQLIQLFFDKYSISSPSLVSITVGTEVYSMPCQTCNQIVDPGSCGICTGNSLLQAEISTAFSENFPILLNFADSDTPNQVVGSFQLGPGSVNFIPSSNISGENITNIGTGPNGSDVGIPAWGNLGAYVRAEGWNVSLNPMDASCIGQSQVIQATIDGVNPETGVTDKIPMNIFHCFDLGYGEEEPEACPEECTKFGLPLASCDVAYDNYVTFMKSTGDTDGTVLGFPFTPEGNDYNDLFSLVNYGDDNLSEDAEYIFTSYEQMCTSGIGGYVNYYIDYLEDLSNTVGAPGDALSLIMSSTSHPLYVSLDEFAAGNLHLYSGQNLSGYTVNDEIIDELTDAADYIRYLEYFEALSALDVFVDEYGDVLSHPLYLSLLEFSGGAYSEECLGYWYDYNYNSLTVPNIELLSLDEYMAEFGCEGGPYFCPYFPTIAPEFEWPEPECDYYADLVAESNYANAEQELTEVLVADFIMQYKEHAKIELIENLVHTYEDQEYHHTLYYYDLAGNLIRTTPPAGVEVLAGDNDGDQLGYLEVGSQRISDPIGIAALDNVTQHDLNTSYKYNTLNQLVWQSTPDGGASKFWYDELGRLICSQNAEQAPLSFSYTRYDDLGRIEEVGEVTHSGGDSGPVQGLSYGSVNSVEFYDWVDNLNDYENNNTSTAEVVYTYYDTESVEVNFNSEGNNQLRNRVSRVSSSMDGDESNPDFATHYKYDIHGNVKELVQDTKELEELGHRYKHIEYAYDLVSGNVHEVSYQKGEVDQFFHKYRYDADNRIVDVKTSNDCMTWERDAEYTYYKHGPLARVETGEDLVQGTDYAYTLHGWLKGVNSNILESDYDMGADGDDASSNRNVGKDEFGFSLGYFNGDYNAIGESEGTYLSWVKQAGDHSVFNENALHNGNISHMITAIQRFKESGEQPLLMGYKYDQLNRIYSSRKYLSTETDVFTDSAWEIGESSDFATDYTYDANGNLLTLARNGYSAGVEGDEKMDNLEYVYEDGTNRLIEVIDHQTDIMSEGNIKYASALTYGTSGTPTSTYAYDAIGNLIEDTGEGITNIEWTVTGKVSKIYKGGNVPELEFRYDAMGNRVVKILRPTSHYSVWEYTYYVRDAQGNVMSTYEKYFSQVTEGELAGSYLNINLEEQHIYGSSRLGYQKPNMVLREMAINVSQENGEDPVYSPVEGGSVATLDPIRTSQVKGDKLYEYSNHLGNVLAVTTDKVIGNVIPFGVDYVFDRYSADVVSAQNYYPFGMIMPGGDCGTLDQEVIVEDIKLDDQFDAGTENWDECNSSVTEVNNELRLTGGVTSIDMSAFMSAFGTTGQTGDDFQDGEYYEYVCSRKLLTGDQVIDGDNLINFMIDIKELEVGHVFNFKLKLIDNISPGVIEQELVPYDLNQGIGVYQFSDISTTLTEINEVRLVFGFTIGTEDGSITSVDMAEFFALFGFTYDVTVDDIKLWGLESQIVETVCPSGPFSSDAYRYGFNGKEKDDEVAGNGNSYDYGFRIYNPRIARFLSVDPLSKSFPFYTPYQFAANMPIAAIDLDGLEAEITIHSPWYAIEVDAALNSKDIKRATYLAMKAVVDPAKDDYARDVFQNEENQHMAGSFNKCESAPEGLTVMDANGVVLFHVPATAKQEGTAGKETGKGTSMDYVTNYLDDLADMWNGGGGIGLSGTGQGGETRNATEEVGNSIDVDALAALLGMAKSASAAGPSNLLEALDGLLTSGGVGDDLNDELGVDDWFNQDENSASKDTESLPDSIPVTVMEKSYHKGVNGTYTVHTIRPSVMVHRKDTVGQIVKGDPNKKIAK